MKAVKAKPPVKTKAKKSAAKSAAKKSVKTAAKKAVAKKAVAKKPAAKTAVAKVAKPAAKKPVAKKTVAKAPARKTAPKPVAVAAPVASAAPQWPPLVMEVLKQLDDSKAEQVVTIDVSRKSTVADVMVVASGRSNRHVNAIADQVVERLEQMGKKNLRVEGMPQCDWVLVDAGDVMVHVFRPEVRSFYNLEKLWSEHAPA